MECILTIGIPGSGKSSFCREMFFDTHVRLNLDMLKTRHRELLLTNACLDAKQPFVVDNCNATRAQRQVYVKAARQAKFSVTGYFFRSRVTECLARNALRTGAARIPDAGVLGVSGQLELPSLAEGFDRLFFVSLSPEGGFQVEDWKP